MSSRPLCPVCEGEAEVVREDHAVPVGQRDTTVECEFARCGECGEEFYLPGQLDEAQKAASSKIREEEGLLQPEEVKRIRDKYGLTQSQLERLLGVGPKTVTRWENGTVFQNAATDKLLRVVDRFPRVAASMAREAGVEIQVPDYVLRHVASFTADQAEPFRGLTGRSGLMGGHRYLFDSDDMRRVASGVLLRASEGLERALEDYSIVRTLDLAGEKEWG